MCQMTYWNRCSAVCLLPWQRRLLCLSLSLPLCLSLSLSPLLFHFPSTADWGHVTALTSSWGGRQAGSERSELVCGLSTNLLLKLGVSLSLSVSISSVSAISSPFPLYCSVSLSLALIFVSLWYTPLFSPVASSAAAAATNSREKVLGDGLLNGLYVATKWGKLPVFSLCVNIVCFRSQWLLPEDCAAS